MPDDPSAPQPTPTNYQRTTGGGHLRWKPPTPEHLQEMLPAYEILSILGQGGMGAVYKGRQKSLDRIVAIKILPPEAGEDDMQFVERFKNEARTMAKMNHPAIVHVYDFGETTEGQLYIVMEFIDGTDVAKMIQAQGKLPEDYALSITAHVCDALQYAHTHGVVHRDIKPANILINMDGQVKVADFGLAKATDPSQMGLTKTNMAMGTPDFVSPEALMPGVPLDGRADLYAVGVMLYNMLSGTIPRGAFRMPSTTLNTDARFDKIILKAMEMDRELRYQTALDLRRDLDVILTTPAAKTGVQSVPAQAAAQQQPAAQKPMGRGPGAPGQSKEGGAGTPARSAPAADKSVRAPAQAPKKSNTRMIYGIAAAVVVIAVAIFLFGGGGKKPVSAPKAVAQSKPEPEKPETKPVAPKTPPPAKPAESKPAKVSTTLPAGKEPWVDGLAQWFGGTKTNDDFTRKPGEAARVGKPGTMRPLPISAPLMHDMAVRARVNLGSAQEKSVLWLTVRSEAAASGDVSGYGAKIEAEERRVRLGWYAPGRDAPGKGFQSLADYPLPADFDVTTAHTLELRVVGDLLTVTLDGRKLGEQRDTRFTSGHPTLGGIKLWVESFEYANLDSGAAAPAVVTSAQSGEVLTFGGHRYQLVKESLAWNSAKARAEAMGGHLVTITSKEEANFVSEKFLSQVLGLTTNVGGRRLMLGGMQPKPGSPWQWITGERFDMSMWVGMQSDPKGDEPHYLNWDYGAKRWDYASARGGYFPLIEWDDDGAATPAPMAAAPPKPPAGSLPVSAPSSSAPVMPAPPADPRLAQLEAGYRARYESDAQKPFLAAVTTLNQSYVANGIGKARATAQAKGALAEITALDAEKTAIEGGSGVPVEDAAGTPDSLKALRGTYRAAYAKIVADRDAKAAPLRDLYVKALDVYIVELTKAGKLDEAKQVQTLLEKIAQQKPAAPSIVTSAPAPPATKTVEFSWRKAAEFIMSDGQSSCRLAKDGQEFVVNAGQLIPDGAYDIIGIYFERFGSPLPQPTDAEFKVFNGLKTLRNMYVRSAPQLTDNAFAFLADNPDLTSLKLANTGVSERLLKHVVGLKNLKTLDISNVRDLTGKGMKEAAYLPVLEELVLQGSQFSNASVAVLSACQNLQQLNLRSTAVTDAGLEHLQSLSRLTSLFISGTKVTDKAIAEFKAAHPQCKVE